MLSAPRLSPDAMYPAGERGIDVRFLRLPSGVGVRTIACGPADGPPVFFVHGWCVSIYAFRRNYRALAEAGFRVYAADLKGHGLSDKPLDAAGYTLDAMADHVREIMDALGLERAGLVGYSMGGAIAVSLALQAPERVSQMALLAPVGFGVVGLIQVARLLTPRLIEPLLPHLAPRWIFAGVLRVAYGRLGRPSARDTDEYWAPTQFPAFMLAMRALAHAFNWDTGTPEELRGLTMPLLVMFGTRDRLVRPGDAERMVDALPHGRMVHVRGAGHVLPEEASEQVNAELLRLFAKT